MGENLCGFLTDGWETDYRVNDVPVVVGSGGMSNMLVEHASVILAMKFFVSVMNTSACLHACALRKTLSISDYTFWMQVDT